MSESESINNINNSENDNEFNIADIGIKVNVSDVGIDDNFNDNINSNTEPIDKDAPTAESIVHIESYSQATPTKKRKKKKIPMPVKLEDDDDEDYQEDDDQDDGDDDDYVDSKNVNNKKKKLKSIVVEPRVPKKRVKKQASGGTPKKKEYDESQEAIQPESVSLYSLGALLKTKVAGREMPSTVEKRRQKSETPAPGRRPPIHLQTNLSQALGTIAEGEGEDDPGTEFEVVDGRIVPKMRDTPLSSMVVYDQADYDTNAFINYNSFARRETPKRWGSEEIERFYEALRKYGTDFSLIEAVFEGRSRSQLKQRFKQEERRNPEMIKELLIHREPINLGDFQRESELVRQKNAKLAEDKAAEANKRAGVEYNEEDELLDDEERAERQLRFNQLNSLNRAGRGDFSEEVIIDSTQQSQQQYQYDQYDFYGFGSDRYDVGDDY